MPKNGNPNPGKKLNKLPTPKRLVPTPPKKNGVEYVPFVKITKGTTLVFVPVVVVVPVPVVPAPLLAVALTLTVIFGTSEDAVVCSPVKN